MHVVLGAWLPENWADAGTIVSILIAFAAAFRPELHSLLRPRRVDVLIPDNLFVELGFNAYGTTLGLMGTLDNEHARSMIRKMRVHAKSSKDDDGLVLSPVLNRERAINTALAGGEEARGKIWLPFLIDADVAVPFDILFRVESASWALTSAAADLELAWTSYANQKLQENEQALSDPDPNKMQANQVAYLVALYNASQGENFMVAARQKIGGAFVWQPRTYASRLEVEVASCDRTFFCDFQFTISDEQYRRLEANVELMIAMVCKVLDPATVPYSAFSKIEVGS